MYVLTVNMHTGRRSGRSRDGLARVGDHGIDPEFVPVAVEVDPLDRPLPERQPPLQTPARNLKSDESQKTRSLKQ